MLELVPAVMRAIRTQMRSRRSVELSVVQFRTLAFLDRRPGASMSDLADHIGLTLPTVSKLVQGLVERGFLRRQSDKNDRRRTALAPTAKGKHILTGARTATRQHLILLLNHLGAKECDALMRGLRLLRPIFLADVMPPNTARVIMSSGVGDARAMKRRPTRPKRHRSARGRR